MKFTFPQTQLKYQNSLNFLELKVKFLRKKDLSHDTTPEIKVWKDAISRLEKLNNKKYDYLCVLPVTSPLRLTKDIDNCIKIFKSKNVMV